MNANPPAFGAPRPKRGDARYRLSGPQAFARVFKEGRRREGRYVQTIAARAQQAEGGCFGMAVSRKALARAVDRNRFKRKVRECWRPMRDALAAYDIVVRLKPGIPRNAVDAAADEAGTLLARWLDAKITEGS